MSRTTIAIHTATRARIRAAAATESQTIDGFLQCLLDEHEKNAFWRSMAELTPTAYTAALSADGDDLDQGYLLEDQLAHRESP